MIEDVAHGRIVVELDDRAQADLERLRRQFDRTMDDIDRQSATVDIDANVDNLRHDLNDAERLVKDYQRRIDESDNNRSKAQLARHKRLTEAKARALRDELANAKRSLAAQKAQNRELALTDKRLDAIAKKNAAEERIREANHRRALMRAREEQRLLDQKERAAARELRDEERRKLQRDRELAQIPKLQREYVILADRIEKLGDAKRRAMRGGDKMAILKVEVQEQEALDRFRRLGDRLEREGVAVDIPVRPNVGRDFGESLRVRLAGNTSLIAIAAAVGADIGSHMGRGMSSRFRHVAQRGVIGTLADLGTAGARAAAGGLHKLGSVLGNLSEMTVRIGPFTATFRQFLVGLSLFAPIIVSLVGALGALTAAAGSAVLGISALGIGFMGGLIPALAGTVLAVKPVAAQFSEAMKASKAYRQEVLQSGKNSEEAKDKLKALEQVLGNVDSRTRDNFKMAGQLGERWEKITAPARAAAFRLIGEGLRFASDNMGQFGRRTNGTVKALEDGFTKMMRNLDTGAFDEMFGNFNKGLRPMLGGIGNLINYLAKVGAVASRSFPGLMQTFKRWSKGILDTTKNADEFEAKIAKIIQSAKNMGNFFMAAGRFLKAFFAGGVDAGNDFVVTMTNALNRWTEFLGTDAGQAKLENFFKRSVDGAQALYSSLAPLISTFVKWSTAMEPIASGFFKGVGAVASLVAKLMDLTALRGPITALATTLGAMWALGRIRAAAGAIASMTAALLGLSRAQTAVNASQGLGALLGAGGAAGRFGRGAALTGMAADIALMGNYADDAGKKSGRLTGALSALKSGALKAAPTLLRLGSVAGIAGTAAVLFGGSAESAADQARDLADAAEEAASSVEKGMQASNRAYSGLAQSVTGAKDAHRELRDAQQELDKLIRAGKEGTQAYRDALQRLNSALKADTQAQRQRATAMEATRNANRGLLQANDAVTKGVEAQKKAFEGLEQARGWIDKARYNPDDFGGKELWELSYRDMVKYADQLKIADGRQDDFADAVSGAKDAMNALATARGADMRAAQQQFVASANLQRALKEFEPLGNRAREVMASLAKSIGGRKTMEIAVKFPNPRQAVQVMQAIDRVISSGVNKKRAIDIVLNSKTAEQALNRLNRIELNDKNLRIIENGGDKAIAKIEEILGRDLTPKEQAFLLKGDKITLRQLSKIAGFKLPKKTQDIRERGGNVVQRMLSILRNFDIGTAIKRITETGYSTVNARLAALRAISSLGTATKGIAFRVLQGPGNATGTIPVPMRGDGGPVLRRRQSDLFERANSLPTVGAGTVARGAKIRKPTMLVGEENRGEYVIATNPAYRKSNIEYLRMAANELGVDMAGGGKKGKSKKGKSKKNRKKRPKHPGPGIEAGNLKEVKGYYELLDKEADANREVSIAESRVREPDSFIMETGTNEWGETTYAIDQHAVDTYRNELKAVKGEYDDLLGKNGIVKQLRKQARAAIYALSRYKDRRDREIEFLQKEIAREDSIINRPIPDGAGEESRSRAQKAKDKARARKQKLKGKVGEQREKKREAEGIHEDIRDDKHDLNYREQEYDIARQDVVSQIKAVGREARDELGSSTPIPPDTGTAAEQRIGVLEAEQALAEAGLGLNEGQGPRSQEAILTDLVGGWKDRIGEARGMLSDKNPYNDEDAYGILASAGSAISGLNAQLHDIRNPESTTDTGTGGGSGGDSGGGTSDQGPTLPQQLFTYSGARSDIFRQFGSNFRTASAFGAGMMAGQFAFGRPAFPVSPFPSGVGSGSQITINNTFPTPPADPHIWSQGIAYELQAAL